tara:strand:+ start:1295 stop:1855 length:561 start_codon:yes stop_codon:yes gene_type:complete
MLENTKEIKKLLIKNNYFVSVSCFGDNANKLYSKLPGRKRRPFAEESLYEYSWSVDDKISPNTVINFKKNNQEYYSTACHKYAVKEIIFSSIIGCCKKINYQESLIGFYVDENPIQVEDFSRKCFCEGMTIEEEDKMDMLTIFAALSRIDDFESIYEYQENEEDEGIVESLTQIQDVYFQHLTNDI